MVDKPISGSTTHITVPGAKPSSTSVVQLAVTNSRDEPVDDKTNSESVADSSSGAAPAKSLPCNLHNLFTLVLGQNGRAFGEFEDKANRYALAVGSRKLDLRIRQFIQSQGERLKKSELTQINDDLQAEAELAGAITNVFLRVAPVTDGIEIDIGDERHTRIRVTAGKVEVLNDE
jgi:hypothetical protein